MIPTPRLNSGQTSQPFTVPAPVGGLNGRDPIAAMDPKDAYVMDNAFPSTSCVVSRRGCVRHNLPNAVLAGAVQSLEIYSGATFEKLLAWAGGNCYDVSLPQPVLITTGLLSSYVLTTMFSNAADNAQHLIVVSGSDTPRRFDGNVMSTLVMTGLLSGDDGSHLNLVFTFKGRLLFAERARLGFYYLPPGQIQGQLSFFDLGQVSRLGGELVAIASFASDAGTTPDDYIVFVTNKGELIVYAGYDPSNSATWELVGRYYSAPPIGRKCTLNYGAELVLLTLDGAVTFSEIRKAGDAKSNGVQGSQYEALTSKLGGYLSAFNGNADTPGWQGIQYSGGSDGWLLLNVPVTQALNGAYYHYVMNTTTNAWCRFTNWNGLCFAVFKRTLYFGKANGNIFKGDVGTSDDGMPIQVDIKQAYNPFDDGQGMGVLTKHFQWASLLISTEGSAPIAGKFNVDYYDSTPPDYISQVNALGAEWDVAKWDEALWTFEQTTQRYVVTLNRHGVVGSMWLRVQLKNISLKWFATQYVMQRTKGMLI